MSHGIFVDSRFTLSSYLRSFHFGVVTQLDDHGVKVPGNGIEVKSVGEGVGGHVNRSGPVQMKT